jgi:tetratricopeptide (TPR) repeat protein
MFLFMQLKSGTASDLAIPQLFRITGKVVVGLDEPVVTVITLRNVAGASLSTQSFANGTFRFNDIPFGTYWLSVVDPRFNLFEDQFLLREPSDSAKELTIKLVRRGESATPPDLDPELYTIDVGTMGKTPRKALDDFEKGVNAIRNPARGNPPDAHFKRAVAAAPDFYEGHLLLGIELQKQNKDNDAIRSFERATAIKPSESRPLSGLGELYSKAEKFEKAADALSRLVQLGKAGARDHYFLGTAFYKLNRLELAEKHLLAAINAGDDKDPAPFLNLHNVFMKIKEAGRALAVLEDYLKLFPGDSNYAAMTERAKQLREMLKRPPG